MNRLRSSQFTPFDLLFMVRNDGMSKAGPEGTRWSWAKDTSSLLLMEHVLIFKVNADIINRLNLEVYWVHIQPNAIKQATLHCAGG